MSTGRKSKSKSEFTGLKFKSKSPKTGLESDSSPSPGLEYYISVYFVVSVICGTLGGVSKDVTLYVQPSIVHRSTHVNNVVRPFMVRGQGSGVRGQGYGLAVGGYRPVMNAAGTRFVYFCPNAAELHVTLDKN